MSCAMGDPSRVDGTKSAAAVESVSDPLTVGVEVVYAFEA